MNYYTPEWHCGDADMHPAEKYREHLACLSAIASYGTAARKPGGGLAKSPGIGNTRLEGFADRPGDGRMRNQGSEANKIHSALHVNLYSVPWTVGEAF